MSPKEIDFVDINLGQLATLKVIIALIKSSNSEAHFLWHVFFFLFLKSFGLGSLGVLLSYHIVQGAIGPLVVLQPQVPIMSNQNLQEPILFWKRSNLHPHPKNI